MGYRDEVLSDTPIAYVEMDGKGGAADVTGSGVDVSMTGSEYLQDVTLMYAEGLGEYSLKMDGRSYVVIKDVGQLIGEDSFTVEMVLVRFPNHARSQVIWSMHDASGDNFIGCWEPNTNTTQWILPAETSSDEGHFYSDLAEYENKRVHFVSVYDRASNSIRVYVDGDEVVDDNYPILTVTPPVPDNAQVTFGMELDGANPSDFSTSGVISQIAIYKGALPSERIASHFAASIVPPSIAGVDGGWIGAAAGWNPSSNPVPNPRGIERTGRSLYLNGPGHQLATLDQMDGSGGNGTPTGGVSDPARMGVIAGTVLDIQAQPVSRRVRVHERATGRIVRETWSDADGKYRFTDLDPRRAFYVMAFDHTLQQNAVVSDNVHSEVEDSP